MSALSIGGRDPTANYGFAITFHASPEDTRVTSYSVRNQPAAPGPASPPQSPTASDFNTGKLSKILSTAAPADEVVTVAFKSLPVDLARGQTGDGRDAGPTTCQAAVENIVDILADACRVFGIVDEAFVEERDVVR